jgi:hypothetical protein
LNYRNNPSVTGVYKQSGREYPVSICTPAAGNPAAFLGDMK